MIDLPGLRFDHGEDIDALRDAVRQFADAEIAPRAADIDRSDQVPMDRWSKMGGNIYIDVSISLSHTGVEDYNGSLLTTLLK